MRKTLSIMALVLALIGCANDVDIQESIFVDENVLTDEQLVSTMPIKFAPVTMAYTVEEMNPTRTSAGVETISNLGLFCLAKRPINDGITENRTPSWSGKSSALINKMSVWKKNIPVSLINSGANMGDVVWDVTMNSNYFPYYPDKDWFAYGFVAYYPRTENIVYTLSTINAYIKVDGSKPVFYSMAKEPLVNIDATTNSLGFSKSYYQDIDAESGMEKYIYPYFTFEYLTSALNIIFWSKGEPQTNLHVEKVEFDNFPCIMMLGLAYMKRSGSVAYDMRSAIATNPFIKNEEAFNDRNLSQFPELTSCLGHFELYDSDGGSISGKKNADGSYKYAITATKRKFGSIYIPPVFAGHSKEDIKIYITIADDAGNKYKNVNPVVINAPTGGWTKGKSYDISIWLNNPSEVAKDASLADWKVETTYDVDATGTNWEEVE